MESNLGHAYQVAEQVVEALSLSSTTVKSRRPVLESFMILAAIGYSLRVFAEAAATKRAERIASFILTEFSLRRYKLQDEGKSED